MHPSEAPSRPRSPRDRLLAWEVLAVGLAVTALAWLGVSRHLAHEARARFDSEIARLDLSLREELARTTLAMDAMRGLFHGPRAVDAQTWRPLVAHLDVQRRFPGMRAMGYAESVAHDSLAAFQRESRARVGTEGRVHPLRPEDDREPYFAVLFLEPELPGFRTDLLGLDLGFEPSRREALQWAVRTGKLAVSPPVRLQGGTPTGAELHPAVVLYLPVPLPTAPPARAAGTRSAPQGMVFATLLTDVFLGNLFGRDPRFQVVVEDAQGGSPLFDSDPGSSKPAALARTLAVPVGQRTWQVHYRIGSIAALGVQAWQRWAVLAGGLAVSAMLFGLLRAQMQARTRAEALASALKDSEDRFRGIADTAACIIILFSERVEYVNDYACALLGYGREEILGRPFWATVHPEDQPLVRARGEARLRGEAVPSRYEFRLVGKDGREHWIDYTAGRIRWGGRVLGLATAFDITDRVEAVEERLHLERKLLEAQRLESLGLLAGGIAHDFNNLLGAILGHASLAEENLADGDPARLNLEQIRATTQRAAELSRQMLAYSGRGTVVVEPVSLSQHVRAIDGLLEVSVPRKIQVRMELGEGLPCIQADAAQLHQVVLNLVSNASEAIHGEGAIRIRTRIESLDADRLERIAPGRGLAPGPFVCLEVEDTGIGMDAATLARVFDPFFSTKFTGRGLGLAAVQGIVQGHGGAIEAESRPGAGSTFRVFFPPCEAPASARHDTGPIDFPRAPTGKVRILIAEDEPALLEATSEVLRRAGYGVVAAADGGAAVERFAEDPSGFDLAILDLTMPVLDGRECFRRIRALQPDLKVILASGYGGLEAGSQFGESELAGFLQKPYRSRELIELVEKVLG